MNIEDFESQFGKVWRKGLRNNDYQVDLREGMLKFTDETHWALANSFHGFGYFLTSSFSLSVLSSLNDFKQEQRFSRFNFPRRFKYKDHAKSELHLQKRLERLTDKELKDWETGQKFNYIDSPTKEFPFRLYICGNDDASYSKFFATEEGMNEELDLLLACQPIHFYNDLVGYIFTN